MNCQQCQERILESLAVSTDAFPSEVAAHRQACPVCREFYDQQASLFRSIDTGLHAIANQVMPPSLAPGLRARLDKEQLPRRVWIPSWSFAIIVAVVAVLAVSVGYIRRPRQIHRDTPEIASVAPRNAGNPVTALQPPPKSVIASPSRAHNRTSSAASLPTPSEAAHEVIVLAEEREAFAKFVAELPEERDVALALTRPAPTAEDVPVEIALLQIESLEVKPMEETPRE
ncbi:MAG: hypothetical protein WBL63_06765 [Candidatus Acidiferrum sp.]